MATDGKQCAHIWAQQEKQSGQGYGSIRFEGDTLYSYREPIARIVENKRGRAALHRDRTWSVTTSKHQSYARSAVSHLPNFIIPDIQCIQSEAVRSNYAQKLEAVTLAAARTRSSQQKEWRIEESTRLADEANKCAEFFGWKWRLAIPEFSPEYVEAVRAKAAKASAAKRKATEERARAEAILMAGRVSEWLRGEGESLHWNYKGETLLRIKGEEVQTSRGARIPVSHARRVWPIILQHKAAGTRYQRNGHTVHVGEFAIDAIEADGTLTAGCHTIGFAQIERIAKELGLI